MGKIKEMHVFVRNFTYATDFMNVQDISSIIDPRLSQVVLGKPFGEISNMTHDPPDSEEQGGQEKRSEVHPGDGIRIPPDGVVGPATGKFENFQVIFDEKKLGRSSEVSLDDSRRTI
nr:MAK10-like protein [Tanacetum cinerariifolium]